MRPSLASCLALNPTGFSDGSGGLILRIIILSFLVIMQSYLRLVTFVGKAASRSSKPAKDSTTRGLHITYHSVLYCTDSLQHIPLIQHQGILQYESLGHILVNQS